MTSVVRPVAVTGEWVRHVPHRSPLLGRATEPTDGRWQRGHVVRAFYLADEPGTATAEWYRFLAERGLPPAQAIPHDQHTWRLNLTVADLRTPEQLTAVGLPPPRPAQRTWPAFQQVGERLWRTGWDGVIAPSAARPSALIVCIFDRGAWPPDGCAPLRATAVEEVPPPPTGMTT